MNMSGAKLQGCQTHSAAVIRRQAPPHSLLRPHTCANVWQRLAVRAPSRCTTRSSNSSREALEALFRLDVQEPRREVAEGQSEGPDRPRGLAFAHPRVDWSLYYLQVLFVGKDGRDPRARLAAGLFERISAWNGFGRAIYQSHCELPSSSNSSSSQQAQEVSLHESRDVGQSQEAASSTSESLDLMASALYQAHQLQLDTKFVARGSVFEVDDLDCNHLVICMDDQVREGALATVPAEYRHSYEEKVVTLTNFSAYESDATLAKKGGFALLPQQLSSLLLPGLPQAKQATHVPVPQDDWLTTIQVLILSTACLAKYLMDAMPDQDWDD